MNLRILGCHGGETPRHHCPAFLIDSSLCIDAGAITRTLTLEQQCQLELILVSHAHLDHVRDLGFIADVRAQNGCPPLTIAATQSTLTALQSHFFNGQLWPDFTRIPSPQRPAIEFKELLPDQENHIGHYRVRPIPVHHSVEAVGYILSNGRTALAYSGDTGPTDLLWQSIAQYPEVAALIIEVAFPNSQQALASQSGHHTPQTLAADLRKLATHQHNLPVMVFHIKPTFEQETVQDLAALQLPNLVVLENGDEFLL